MSFDNKESVLYVCVCQLFTYNIHSHSGLQNVDKDTYQNGRISIARCTNYLLVGFIYDFQKNFRTL
jgi:hypothetical protein